MRLCVNFAEQFLVGYVYLNRLSLQYSDFCDTVDMIMYCTRGQNNILLKSGLSFLTSQTRIIRLSLVMCNSSRPIFDLAIFHRLSCSIGLRIIVESFWTYLIIGQGFYLWWPVTEWGQVISCTHYFPMCCPSWSYHQVCFGLQEIKFGGCLQYYPHVEDCFNNIVVQLTGAKWSVTPIRVIRNRRFLVWFSNRLMSLIVEHSQCIDGTILLLNLMTNIHFKLLKKAVQASYREVPFILDVLK